jgi:hypothetical protein
VHLGWYVFFFSISLTVRMSYEAANWKLNPCL